MSMEQINRCTDELIDAILESEEYREFCMIRDRVAREPGLRDQINEFRLNVYTVQNSREPLDLYEEQQRLCRTYEEFRRNPLVNHFLQAELRVCRMIQHITAEMAERVDRDTAGFAARLPM